MQKRAAAPRNPILLAERLGAESRRLAPDLFGDFPNSEIQEAEEAGQFETKKEQNLRDQPERLFGVDYWYLSDLDWAWLANNS